MLSLQPVEATDDRIVLACDAAMRKLAEPRLPEIEALLRRLNPSVRVELAAPAAGEPAAPQPAAPAQEPEIVRLAAELFGARVVNVQRKDRPDGL